MFTLIKITSFYSTWDVACFRKKAISQSNDSWMRYCLNTKRAFILGHPIEEADSGHSVVLAVGSPWVSGFIVGSAVISVADG